MSSFHLSPLHLACASLVAVSLYATDCPYQVCNCYGATISCEEKGLTTVPLLRPGNYSGYTTLILDGNDITRISAASLPPALTSISLINNPTAYIDDTAFDSSADTLMALTLSSFRFTRIPDALLRLNTLQTLTIYEAPVLDWNTSVMAKLCLTLRFLYLEDVGLKAWPDWIEQCVHLTHLTVVGGTISMIPPGALRNVSHSLTNLYLYSNRFLAVPEVISNCTSLLELNMRNNTISELTWIPRKSKLTSLALQNNRISDADSLSEALIPFMDSLQYIYLEDNLLTSVPNVSFLTQVGSLDFSQNRISNVYLGAVHPNVFSLDLGYNRLAAVPGFMSKLMFVTDLSLPSNVIRNVIGAEFPPNTVTVELAFNYITELTDTSFPEHSKIRFLHLNNNPLVRISPLAFKNIPLLIELNLESTKLTRMPQTLAFLTTLNTVDFTNSDELVCTCMEKDLEGWVKSLFPTNVVGMCGDTSIYDFFTKLSSQCP